MSDDDKKPARKPLTLKGAQPGEVKQTFSHGRTNKVAVEVKRRRKLVKPGEAAPPPPPPPPPPAPEPTPAPVAKKAPPKKAAPAGETPQERVARLQREAEEERLRLAEEARKREEEQARKAAEDEKKRAEENRKAEEEAVKQAAEQAKKAKEAPKDAPKEDVAAASKEAPPKREEKPSGTPAPAPRRFTPVARPEPKKPERKKKEEKPARGAEKTDKRRSGKLSVKKALNEDEGRRARSLAALKRAREKERRMQGGGSSKPREKQVRDVVVPEAITVGELAKRMGEKGADLVKELFNLDMMVTVNQTIDQDTAELLVTEFGHNIERVSESDIDIDTSTEVDTDESLKPRAPVVAIMGHVDHGKTSLLDALRGTDVVRGEAGGITQHIGAYQIKTDSGAPITFLDTPGHAAFTSMRARGAQVTDIVILVVAADDAVMPQTVEAIHHAKAAEVPMIIAINKVDKPGADANKVRQDLLRHEVVVEAMSGDVQDVEVSAKTGAGLDTLLEAVALQAEILELRANPERDAEGAVIEAKLDTGRGPVATVLIQRGTLKRGDIFVVGEQWGRVRALINDQGARVDEAGPSVPVEVLGLQGTPGAGDVLNVVESEAKAREISDYRQRAARDKLAASGPRASLDQLLAQAKADENVAELPVLVKADVQGSTEAIVQALEKIGNDDVRVRVLHSGVGAITETDVGLAEASNAPLIGFNVRANAPAREAANQKGVEIRYYSIIYDLVDDVKLAAQGLLKPEVRETFIGYAKIKEVFRVSNVGKVAGCEVTEGVARRSAGVRLLRDDVVIHEGKLKTLKRFKDEVPEVRSGTECGMAFENYEDIREGDVIEIFTTEEVARTL